MTARRDEHPHHQCGRILDEGPGIALKRSRVRPQIDVIAVYCPNPDAVYYVPAQSGIHQLRIGAAKNGQAKGVHLASDYRAFV